MTTLLVGVMIVVWMKHVKAGRSNGEIMDTVGKRIAQKLIRRKTSESGFFVVSNYLYKKCNY